MNRPLRIRAEAEAEIVEVRAWYEGQRAGLGDEFLLCLEEAFDRVQRMPGAGEPLARHARRSLIRRFP